MSDELDVDWDAEPSQEEIDAGLKALSMRIGAPHDFYSPGPGYTAHDRLRSLSTSVGLALAKGDPLRDATNELRDVIEDHERLLRMAIWLRELLEYEARKLDKTGGHLNAENARQELLQAIGTIDVEMSRLYLGII